MRLRYHLSLAATLLGASAFAQDAKSAEAVAAPMKPAAGPTPVGTVAPFGYYQTQWRAFPTAAPIQPKPVEAPPPAMTREPAPASLPKEIASARPIPAPPTRPVMDPLLTGVPVPHPASMNAAKADRGFATLRSVVPVETSAPAAPTVKAPARAPSLDNLRPARHDDEVMRADWPVLPPLPKK